MRVITILVFLFSTLAADPPKVVIFDYGGVVAKVDRKPVIEFLSQSLNIPYKKIRKDFASERLYKAFNKPPSFWEKYAKQPLSKDWFRELDAHKNEIVQPIPGMHELIHKIKEQKIQVALLSNTNKYRARFLNSKGGYDLFDPVVLSCHIGVSKPDPKIYHKLLRKIQWSANECLFIDNKKENIQAGKKLGIDGVVFSSVEQLRESLSDRGLAF